MRDYDGEGMSSMQYNAIMKAIDSLERDLRKQNEYIEQIDRMKIDKMSLDIKTFQRDVQKDIEMLKQYNSSQVKEVSEYI